MKRGSSKPFLQYRWRRRRRGGVGTLGPGPRAAVRWGGTSTRPGGLERGARSWLRPRWGGRRFHEPGCKVPGTVVHRIAVQNHKLSVRKDCNQKQQRQRERERERERESVCTNSREPTSTHFGVVWPFGTGMMTANASMLQTNIGGPFSETLAAANLRGGPFKQRQIACVITGCD